MKYQVLSSVMTIFAVSSVALGATTSPAPSLAASAAPAVFYANIANIKAQILNDNLSIETAYDQVKVAKDQLNEARTNLLPSVNVSALQTLTSTPTFVVNSISFLLPFLLPQNWLALSTQQDEFNAQTMAYEIMELNTYSSALSLYLTAWSDSKSLAIYEQEAEAQNDLATIAQAQFDDGMLPQSALASAQAAAASMQGELASIQTAEATEVAALRQALNLPLSTTISFDQADDLADTHGLDGADTQTLVNQANSIAPEAAQINDEIAAQKVSQTGGLLGFISSLTISAVPVAGQNTTGDASLSNLRANGSVSFGPSMIPAYFEAQDNIQMTQLELSVLVASNTEVIESNQKALQLAIEQFNDQSLAESKENDNLTAQQAAYDDNMTSQQAVLSAKLQVAPYALSAIAAGTAKSQALLTLQRALLQGPFADIKGCQAKTAPKAPGGFFSWLGGLFGGNKNTVSGDLDKLCRGQSS